MSKKRATVGLIVGSLNCRSNSSRMVGSSVTGEDYSINDCAVEMAVGLIERLPVV